MIMKKYEITNEVLKSLADALLNDLRRYDGDNDVYSFNVESGEYFAIGSIVPIYSYEDQSFSHEFGIHRCGEWKLAEVESSWFDIIGYVDEDGDDYELHVTNE